MMQWILRPPVRRRAIDFVAPKAFVRLTASDRDDGIFELCSVVADAANLKPDELTAAVLARERLTSTALGHQVAVPHCRLPHLTAPIIAVGVSHDGIDFDSPDGIAVRLVVLLLTPEKDPTIQLELLADIARSTIDEGNRRRLLEASSYTEFRALIRSVAEHAE
jgi:PTS system nitrogen regulatory IIA component